MNLMGLILSLFFTLTLMLGGCSSSNDTGPSTDGVSRVHETGILNPASANFHAVRAASSGTGSCGSCHSLDLRGSETVPGCDSCHFSLSDFSRRTPADSTWTHGTNPHSQLQTVGATCNNCHEALRQYPGQGPDNCHDCHAGASHPVGQAWLDPASATFHGLAATNDLNACSSCHGSDFLGGTTGVSCSQCHFGPSGSKVPAGENWTHSSIPHNSTSLTDAVAICNQCHMTTRLYGQGPGACHDCHTGASHPVGQVWLDKNSDSFHGRAAQADAISCQACHGADYLGGTSGVSCSRCHFGSSGARTPAADAWRHGDFPHGTDLLTSAVAICNQCHTTNRLYGNGPNTCHDCHVSASHATGQSWLDKNSTEFHGSAAQSDVDSCKSCHGGDLAGGSSGVSCNQCHFGPAGSRVPPAVNWIHGSIPHQDLAPYSATCIACHDLNRLYNNGPSSCHNCHAEASHPLGQAWLDVNSSNFHGLAARAEVDSCTQCHGSDYTGGSSGVSCNQCHFGPTGSNVPAGTSWTHGSTAHASLASSEAVCNTCHTLQRSFGNGPSSCHDCHGSGMHVTGQAWLDGASSSFHGTAANANLDSCRSCHGAALDGGTANVSCSDCHFGPTGSRVPAGISWTHGSSHGSLGSYEATCNQCHTLTRQFRNQPNTCHDCHGSGVPHATGASWLLPSQHAQQSVSNRSYCLGCHSLSGSTGTSPSCGSCHTQSDPPLSIGGCISCHENPPRTGEHRKHVNLGINCADCHNSFGTGSLQHYDPNPAPPADIRFGAIVPATFMATFDGSGNLQSCNGSCHIGGESENHENERW